MTPVRLTLGWIAGAVGGRLIGGTADTEVGEVVIDSRWQAAGDLFVAIRGPRFDGHDFVADVLERGAGHRERRPKGRLYGDGTARAISEGRPGSRRGDQVADTVKALQDLAHAVRRPRQHG